MKRQVRRHDHIAKDLRTPKYRPRVVRDVTKDLSRDPILLDDDYEEYYPLNKDNDN